MWGRVEMELNQQNSGAGDDDVMQSFSESMEWEGEETTEF